MLKLCLSNRRGSICSDSGDKPVFAKSGSRRKKRKKLFNDVEMERQSDIEEEDEEGDNVEGDDDTEEARERKKTKTALDDESYTEEEAAGRRSSRIQNNRFKIEEKQKEQKELERRIDESIESGKRKKAGKLAGLSFEDCTQFEDDDDEIKVEKVIGLPPRKKPAVKLAGIFLMGKKPASAPKVCLKVQITDTKH